MFNKRTATGVMAFASTQDPINIDEERELDERFISTGVHVDLDEDADPHTGEEFDPLQGDFKETQPAKRAKSSTPMNSKKSIRKGERISEMTDAINNFARIAEKKDGT